MLYSVAGVAVCDASNAESSNTAGLQKNFILTGK